MERLSYFSKSLTGGMHNSIGLNYQDGCAAFILLQNLIHKENKFLSLGIETINDFSIHEIDRTFSSQVKKMTLTVSKLKDIIKSIYLGSNFLPMIIVTEIHEDLRAILKKRNQYKNILISDFDDTTKMTVKNQFFNELSKFGLSEWIDVIVNCKILEIPEHDIDDKVKLSIYTWMDKKRVHFNIDNFIDHLNSTIQKLRSQRGIINMDLLNKWIQNNSTEANATKIIKEVYESFYIKPSQFSSILGESKEEILSTLENKLELANNYYEIKDYFKARKIFKSLSNIYEKEFIYLNCAVLAELCSDLNDSINYCDLILEKDNLNYPANFIKGTCLAGLKKYDEALLQFENTLKCKETAEVYYNIGCTYLLGFKEYKKAIRYFNKSIQLKEKQHGAHINLSACYFELMDFEKSLIHVNRSIELEPSRHEGYGRKGEIYRYFGLFDDAISYFHKCLKIDKTNFQALYGISLSYSEKGFISEACIYLTKLFNEYPEWVLDKASRDDTKAILIDLGWKRVITIPIEIINKSVINVNISGTILPINLKNTSKDFIFIGSEYLNKSTDQGFSIVGKIYEKKENFQEVLGKIKGAVNLFQFFDHPIYVDFEEKIEVLIDIKKDYVLIKLLFNNEYQIIGMTNNSNNGYQSFVNYFNEHKQCKIQLECVESNELFVIDGLKNVKITQEKIII